jgi:hypothetical protein
MTTLSADRRNLLDTIDRAQDGAPLHKYIKSNAIDWSKFDSHDIEDLSFATVLDLLLVKATGEDDPVNALEYATKQLQSARRAIEYEECVQSLLSDEEKQKWLLDEAKKDPRP